MLEEHVSSHASWRSHQGRIYCARILLGERSGGKRREGVVPGCPLRWSQPTLVIRIEWQMRENKLSLLAYILEGELAGLKINGYEGKRRIRTCF